MWKGSGWVVSGGVSAPECGVVYMGGDDLGRGIREGNVSLHYPI